MLSGFGAFNLSVRAAQEVERMLVLPVLLDTISLHFSQTRNAAVARCKMMREFLLSFCESLLQRVTESLLHNVKLWSIKEDTGTQANQ